ncbi:MAG: 50S ribosomal protein L29 [Nanoarchaeota archaeon]|nr:50S ribosomal protein L29 [Nanoarchaeota archaeon]
MAIKIKEIQQMEKAQLESKLKDLKKDLMKINTQKSTGSNPENPGKIKQIKRTIAKILTTLNNKNWKEVKTSKT